jgi:NitT/TauT family transport system substrate-binding protein
MFPWPGYEPLLLARDLHYYGQDNPVQVVEFTSASESIRSFRNGAIEVASLTLDEVLTLAQYESDLCVVLVMDVSQGADVILGRPGMTDLHDLQGRRVGVESTALGAYVLARALEISGMTLKDVQVSPVLLPEHERAFLEGTVDAVVTFEPVKTRLMAAGAVKLFDSTRIPGEIVDVLVVRRPYLRAHADQVEALIRGWFRAVHQIQKEPKDSAKRISGYLKVQPDEFLSSLKKLPLPSLEENRRLLSKDGRHSLYPTAKRLARTMREYHLLSTDVDLETLLEPKPLLRISPP